MEPGKKLDIHFSIPLNLPQINWRAWLPSRGNVLFTLVVIFTLFWAQSANALPWAAPEATSTGTWPYQGRLADSAGNPITATVPMVFRLYKASSGGTPLWEEQWTGSNSVQVSDGLFNVMLGSLTAIPQSTVTGNGTLWLGITAGTDDEMAPRVQLGSVPYAVQALTVPNASITTAKIADKNVTTAKIADGAVTQAKLGADVSLIPPDGSITSAKISDGTIASIDLANSAVTRQKLGADVSLVQIQSGRAYGNTDSPGWNLATSTPNNHAYYVIHVTFPQSFATVPTVSTAIAHLDDASETNTRITVYAENITTTGFDMVFDKWHITIVYAVGASWIAYADR